MNSTLNPKKKVAIQFSWKDGRDYILIFCGTLLQALALRIFLVPANLASGGVSGLAQIVNHYTGWPIGLMIFLGNLPLFLLGWRYLGGRRFVLRTGFAIMMLSFFTDFLAPFLPQNGVTQDPVLNTLYGAIISGIGYGLVYRGQGTSGGSDILARILNHWRGISINPKLFDNRFHCCVFGRSGLQLGKCLICSGDAIRDWLSSRSNQ